jgi:hypothetical protein
LSAEVLRAGLAHEPADSAVEIDPRLAKRLAAFAFTPTGSVDIDEHILYGRRAAGEERHYIARVRREDATALGCIAWFEAHTPPGVERCGVRVRTAVSTGGCVK